jgi:hypothetical protein
MDNISVKLAPQNPLRVNVSQNQTGQVNTNTRHTVSLTTDTLVYEEYELSNITAAKTYSLLKVYTSAPCWITLYNTDAARTADLTRTINDDPLVGSGVIAEFITTDAQTQYLTPAVIGFNDENPVTNVIFVKVVNTDNTARSINFSLTYLTLEV